MKRNKKNGEADWSVIIKTNHPIRLILIMERNTNELMSFEAIIYHRGRPYFSLSRCHE